MGTAVILGGGISGLATAFYLCRSSKTAFQKIVLLEGSARLGGWMQSHRESNGAVYEFGPKSIRVMGNQGKNTLRLVEELGLDNDVVSVDKSHPATKNRFVYVNKKLHALPNSLGSLFRKQAPFSKPLLANILKEPFTKPEHLQDDTVHNFVARRLGPELADYAISSLCRGVYAGDSKKLSVRGCFPDLFRWEQEHGSIIRGMLASRTPSSPEAESALVERSKQEKWSIWSLREGTQQLADSLGNHLQQNTNVEFKMNSPCTKLELIAGKARVHTPEEVIDADHVFSTVLAGHLAPLVEHSHEVLYQNLRQVPAVTVAVVVVEYDGDISPIQGFGHLVPACEDSKVLGVLYDSVIFPNHNRKDRPSTRFTCMMGGAWFEEMFGDQDTVDIGQFAGIAVEAIGQQLGITEDPIKTETFLQKECIPQYIVGHTSRLEEMREYIGDQQLPLSLLGSSFTGVGVNDCIYKARLQVESLLQNDAYQ